MESSRRDLLNGVAEHRSSWELTKIRTPPLFFKVDLCSAISMESSRRDLSNDVAELRFISKNVHINDPRFSFIPKPSIEFPKTSVPEHIREYPLDHRLSQWMRVQVAASELVWGYDDRVYSYARAAAQMSPLQSHGAPPNVRFGLLAAKNCTGERLAIHTGAGNLSRMGNIVRWNNEPAMRKWSGECDALEASDAGVFPPLKVRRKEPILVFKAEACRRIQFEFSHVTSVFGMETHRYLIPENEFHMSKGPKCYCEFNGCLPDGLFDTSPCSYGQFSMHGIFKRECLLTRLPHLKWIRLGSVRSSHLPFKFQ